jgi:hypothetical protein
VILLLASLAQATCPSPPSAVEAALDSAQLAFRLMDRAAFATATDEVRRGLECLAEPVTPTLAARIHRVTGLREFVAGNDAAARLAFAAARAIDPSYSFPESIVPAGHPVHALYASATEVSAAVSAAPTPAQGHLEFDGTATPNRPGERPTLALLVGGEKVVSASAYLWPGDPLFPYAVASSTTASRAGKGKGPSWPLAIAAAASGLAAGGAYAWAAESRAEFDDMATPDAELSGLRDQTNALQLTAWALGAASLGLGVGAVVAGSW